MIAANHVSYVDVLVLAASTPVVFVAKREVRGWPIFGWFARMAGTRFVDREHRADVARVGRELAPALAQGISVGLFLEGTSSDGRRVLPFKSSLLEPAIQLACPVAPVALAYQVPPTYSAASEVCWWGDMRLIPHLFNLAGISAIEALVTWGDPLQGFTNRKQLAVCLHTRVTELHRTISPPPDLANATSHPYCDQKSPVESDNPDTEPIFYLGRGNTKASERLT